MKIAIQGHPTRGKKVIQILESLGGINSYNHSGSNPACYYEIHGNAILCACTKSDHYKYYTLEEFETQFPFKVGDIVQTKPCGEPAEVINLYPNPACIIAYKVRYKSGVEMQYCPENIKFYKEMKEERNITLTFDKAKEWYRKGGELKEIALQAFTEKELNPFPRSWEEFATNHARMGYYISADGKPLMCASSGKLSSPHVCPSQKSAEAHLALIQLEQLRDCWRGDWKPEWNNCEKYVIKWDRNDLIVFTARHIRAFLVFPTSEMAEEFLECFRSLIEQAGDLI